MKVNGIVAEYNPFHNGHKYHIEESMRLTGADFTVIVMSGNFVQRGAPALVEKRLRTEMALRCGADLVLELPVLYATASSEFFAAGSMALLDQLGVVTHLCFGSECGDLAALRQIAVFLAEEPESYRTALKQLLKQGLSYPLARARALALQAAPAETAEGQPPQLFPGKNRKLPDICDEILSSPNNILGIDYIKELIKRKSDIEPVTVKRLGAGYHAPFSAESLSLPKPYDSDLPGTAAKPVPAAFSSPISALAIRQALYEGQTPDQMHAFMPPETCRLLNTAPGRLLYPDSLSGLLYYKLLLEKEQGYDNYLDVSADLSNRIQNNLNRFTGFSAFCDLLKTKTLTHTRISRCLLHILLNIQKEDMTLARTQDYTPYARVLGFRRSAQPLLHAIGAHSAIPLITKLADTRKKLPTDADRFLKQDIFASEIYKGLAYSGSGRPAPNEYSTPLVLL